jgi:DNA-binding CsgD family transcriptional regulator
MDLYERDHELAAIERAIAEGGAVLIVGSFGMGKSSILAAARRLARSTGAGVAIAQGAELEQGYRGGVVRQLVDGAIGRLQMSRSMTFDDVLDGLEARGRPVCVIVDDLQWVDEPSMQALQAGLSGGSGLAFVGSFDPTPDGAEAVSRTLPDVRTRTHRLEPLSARGVRSMVEDALGRPISAELADRYHAATGGRPVLVQQLIAELRRRGKAPSASALVAMVQHPPTSVRRTVARSLGRLPHGAQKLAGALAVAAGDAPATALGRLAGMDEATVAASALRLQQAELLAPRDAAGFSAPLIGAAIEASLTLAERSALHAGVAELLLEAGAPHGDVARHILQAPQHAVPGAGAALAGAVADAQDRGEPQSVIRYLQRALQEAPEPAPEVLAALGSAQLRLGRIGEATATLGRALGTITEPEDRFRAAAELGCALIYEGRTHEAMEVVSGAAAAARELRSEAAHVLEATQALAGWSDLDVFRQFRRAVPLMRHEPARPRSLGDHVHVAQLAVEHAMHGSANDARRLAVEAMAQQLAGARHLMPFYFRELALAVADHPAATLELARVEEAARRTDSEVALRIAHALQAMAHLRRGELDAVVRLGRPAAGPLVAVHLAECRLERGLLEAAEDALAHADARHFGWRTDLLRPLTLGRLRVRQGRARDALAAFRRCAHVESQWGFTEPAHACWRSEAALAHHLVGETSEARSLAEEAVDRTRRFGSGRLQGMALRAAARVGAVGPAEAVLEQAVEVLEGAGAQLEAARARADLGSLLRRQGRVRDAREPLSEARALALAAGAAPLAAFATQELELSGEGSSARGDRDALTPAERRTAALAADGFKNREIAATLLISEKTVELQLTQAYRKLGISSRKQLPRALGH